MYQRIVLSPIQIFRGEESSDYQIESFLVPESGTGRFDSRK